MIIMRFVLNFSWAEEPVEGNNRHELYKCERALAPGYLQIFELRITNRESHDYSS